ncbi:MAG TPA: polysaccharide biosynthesis/export family protein [Candidatus Polarisedimenticolia bacterium]|jgi:polysaccharide export outer membrane protein|nr:polysaccharide biosynthesis/export family protein [Candidatus Polarisedimenticolia bacterium]
MRRSHPWFRRPGIALFSLTLTVSLLRAQNPAATLLEVRPDGASGTIRLICDGAFNFVRTEEADPSRVVLELPGVKNGLTQSVTYRSDLVKGITISSLKGQKTEGTRVVFELNRPCPVSLRPEKDSLAVVLQEKSAARVVSASPGEAPALKAPLAAGIAGKALPPGLKVSAVGVPSEYTIGKEDLLEIGVFEQPDLTRTVRVSGDGTISVPLLGTVPLDGLTTKEAESRLRDLLSDRYLNDPQVWVFVKEAKSKKVSVVGAVEKPGTIEMLGNRTLLETISEAGGLTPQAGRDLYVLRPDASGAATRIDVDLDDLMIKGKPELNIAIVPGDVINIPIDRLHHVYVDGAVRKPGEVEYKASRPLTLLQAIAAAGGLSERASQKGIVVVRTRPGSAQELIKVDLRAVRKGKQDNFVLESGDSIYVPETFF